MPDVSVVIPTIPPREALLAEALHSVQAQTSPVIEVVEVDEDATGAAATRNRALERVETSWVAFLDDDDLWKPHHVETLLAFATANGDDAVWSWYDRKYLRGADPFAYVQQLDQPSPLVPIPGLLIRADLIRSVGGFALAGPGELVGGEDARLTQALRASGHEPRLLPDDRTWFWRWRARGRVGTSGMPWTTKYAQQVL